MQRSQPVDKFASVTNPQRGRTRARAIPRYVLFQVDAGWCQVPPKAGRSVVAHGRQLEAEVSKFAVSSATIPTAGYFVTILCLASDSGLVQ